MSQIETDVVVVGAGVTGLAAALTALEGGARVMVFEKQSSPGGCSNFFEGTYAVESSMQLERYIDFTRGESFKSIMDYSHWKANARLVRAIVEESAATIDWLTASGVTFLDATINMPNAPRTYHVIKGRGAAVVKALSTKIREMGGQIKVNSPVTRILKTGDKITGVMAEVNDEEIEITAKAVIVGSGGYANNKKWIKKYTGFNLDENLFSVGNIGKDGDGIRMAWECGAADENMGTIEIHSAGLIGPEYAMKSSIEIAAAHPDLWVSPQGERFCDETIGFYDSSTGNANAQYPEGFTYHMFDDAIKLIFIEKGITKNNGMDYTPGTKLPGLDEDIASAIERGSTDIYVADSVEGLAEKMGVDPRLLVDTVAEYNQYCESGYDALFYKDRRYLRPLVGPRFYAVKSRTLFLGTLGGIKINHNMEVISKKNEVIAGLYAGGFDAAGGICGDSYAMQPASGFSSAFACNSGRIAGKNALRYIRNSI